jgi:hypothetical protein
MIRTQKRGLISHLIGFALGLSFVLVINATAQTLPPMHVDDFTGEPRIVILTDMGNEPDDQPSFVRLLPY